MQPSRIRTFGLRRIVILGVAAALSFVAAQSALASAADQAVAYQLNAAHDGYIADAGLATPLTQQWSVTLPAASYPLIVNGMVFVTAADNTVYALNQATGSIVWSHAIGGTYPSSGLSYDRGQVFVLNNSGLLIALDPMSGAVAWSTQLTGQSQFSSAPTAVNGIVYAGGAGSDGTLYAVRERDGHVAWARAMQGGEHSSPAVDAQNVYVSYACQQEYAFGRATGTLVWHRSGPCTGGGGRTPVVAGGTVFARDPISGNLMLAGSTGATLGPFNAGPAPAVANGVAFMLDGATLKAIANSGQGTTSWQFTGDGHLDTAPLAVGSLVFVGSSAGALYAVDAGAGTSSWSTNVGSAIPSPDERNVSQPLTGMGAANGTLIVPVGTKLIAYRTAGAISAPPANQTGPTMDGKPQVGQRVAADVGIWSGLPDTYTYQWELCDSAGSNCGDVAGATGVSFTPAGADVGKTLRVKVVGTNSNGSSSPVESSASTPILPPAPANQAAPAISGVPQQGEVLTAGHGTWSGSPAGYSYQWFRCSSTQLSSCASIPGATGASYTAAAADVDYQLEVQVVATGAGGDSDPADSALTALVASGEPVNVTLPTIKGTAQDGQTVTADPGTWTRSPTAFSYYWFRCNSGLTVCDLLLTATAQSYPLNASDIGGRLFVGVIATNDSGDSELEFSPPTSPVLPAAPSNQVQPSVSGRAQAGQTLTAVPGTWSGSPTGYTYQWTRCNSAGAGCTNIPGATASAYLVTPADVGERLAVQVVGVNAGGRSLPAGSSVTAVVMPALDRTFKRLRMVVTARGALRVYLKANNPGKYKGTATTSAASLAPRGASPRSRGAVVYASGSAVAAQPGTTVLLIKPAARARRAISSGRRIRVRVKVIFRSALGGTPSTQVYSLTVRGRRSR